MNTSNRVSGQTNGSYQANQEFPFGSVSVAESNPVIRTLRQFIGRRPATALLTGATIGSVLGWLTSRKP